MKALKAKMFFDGTGVDPVENPVIVIDGQTIRAVLRNDQTSELDPNVEIIDCQDHWILPGFIDLHVHLRNPHDDEVPRADQFRHRIALESPLAVLYGARAAQRCLAAGFTSIRNMGGVEFVALDRAFEAGLLPGPRVFTSGMVLKTGGHTDSALPATLPRQGAWSAWTAADGVEGVRTRVRELARAGAAFIKLEASGGLYKASLPGHRAEELAAATEEAHGLGLTVAVHAHSREGILSAVRAGADTIEHGTFMDETCIDEMVRHGTTFVPTMTIMGDSIARGAQWGYTKEFLDGEKDLLRVRMNAVRLAHAAGVPIALGTDSAGWIGRHGDNAREFALLVEAGLSPLESLAAGTGVAAKALGMADRLGTISAGKRADLVVVNGDPVKDISVLGERSNIMMAWKDGELLVDRRPERSGSTLVWEAGD